MAVFHLHFLSFLILALHFSLASPTSDLEALMAFKASSDHSGALAAHWTNLTAGPCSWLGVQCTASGRVNRLVLEGLALTGSLEPLRALTQLRVLSLNRNNLSGVIPDLTGLKSLKLLFLSRNSLSGEIPSSVSSLSRLYRLDLSYNRLSGEIPVELNRLTHLLTLRLESNRFSGPISSLNLPNLQDLNVSENFLSGRVSETLAFFPESAFSNNPSLCVKNCSAEPVLRPGAIAANSTVVSSSPTQIPANTPANLDSGGGARARMSTLALVAIILGDVLVVLVISLLLYCFYSAKMASKSSKLAQTEKIVYSSSPYPIPAAGGGERGRMVFFEGVRRFELEDLLRASAEMLGKGGFGTAYKAVLDDGTVVAVKRLKDSLPGNGRREFESHMEVLGKLRHPNLVSLRAYYFAREEKLLVYDFMPNGTLFWLLHGNRGPGRTPLDWTTRLKIASGAARGLAFIHTSCKALKLAHGNVKSTNILVDHSGNARVSDFGLSVFTAAAGSAARSNGYRAPESGSDPRKLTPKSDVYSFGVLLLEILTGKCPNDGNSGGGGGGDLPRWVQSVVREEWTAEVFDLELMRYKDIEEEMVGLLQIAMVCTSAAPDQRPRMSHVVKMIEEIRGYVSSPGHDSVSESPSVSEDTSQ